MKGVSIAIFVLMMFYSTSCIYMGLSNKEVCIDIEQDTGKVYKFFYEVNGANPESFETYIEPKNGVGSVKLRGAKNYTIFSADQ